MFSRRRWLVHPICDSVSRVRNKMSVARSKRSFPRLFKALRAINSAGLNPRSRRLRLYNGTGMSSTGSGPNSDFNFNHGFCKHAFQNARRRSHAVVLQQMNKLPQSSVVAAVSRGPQERTIHASANRATEHSVPIAFRIRMDSLPAHGTHSPANSMDSRQTIAAHGPVARYSLEACHKCGTRKEIRRKREPLRRVESNFGRDSVRPLWKQ